MSHCNLVHKFVLMPPIDENSRCESSSGKRMGEARKVASVAIDKGKEQNGVFSGGTKREKNSPFCYADGHPSPQKCGVGTEVLEIQRLGCAPR